MSLNDTIDILGRVDAKIDILIEQRDRAIYALRRYGKHDKNCGVSKHWASELDGQVSTGSCTCGFKSALESPR